jgi:thioredoxin reductase/NAD-dependent dihydropyrimidine dehydrogenase PreA subunit
MEYSEWLMLGGYAAPFILIWVVYLRRTQNKTRQAANTLADNISAGLTEPASLHPVIDPNRCVGSGGCAVACPEGNVIGIIRGKGQLIEPTRCIGHGACRLACPHGAISLVFGTAKRGVDIPHVSPDFQTNVPGLYIAGELGGMGLIRNAVNQGSQAMDAISRLKGLGQPQRLDVVIVGAGPAGLAAALAAKEKGLSYALLDQDSLGGTVAHFPRGKVVMTAPAVLPIVGKVRFTEVSKEELLAFWEKVVADTGLEITSGQKVDDVVRDGDGFEVRTATASYRSRAVLLAIGRRGTPRKLGVPGEELNKVVYRLIDPEQYRGQRVLVVGGGDSAMEAAATIADEPGTTVTLSYRSEAFSRAKEKNRKRVAQAQQQGRLQLVMSSNVKAITADSVELEQGGERFSIGNDAVIVSAGGVLPIPFLKQIGIEVETKYGTQ